MAIRREYAGNVACEPQRALQLRDALDFERERHPRLMLARLRIHSRDVDLLARQQFGNVAQQSLAIASLDDDVDRKELIARGTPIGFDQPLRLSRANACDVRTFGPMDRDPLAARDETDDRVGWRGLAASRESGQ